MSGHRIEKCGAVVAARQTQFGIKRENLEVVAVSDAIGGRFGAEAEKKPPAPRTASGREILGVFIAKSARAIENPMSQTISD